MAAIPHHSYHETDESREVREMYNERNTGEKGSTEEPATLIELPTAAGSVMLDLEQHRHQASAPRSVSSSASSKSRSSTVQPDKTKKVGIGIRHGRRKSEELRQAPSENEQPTGGASSKPSDADSRSPALSGSASSLPQSVFSKTRDDDEAPPLTAEVCTDASLATRRCTRPCPARPRVRGRTRPQRAPRATGSTPLGACPRVALRPSVPAALCSPLSHPPPAVHRAQDAKARATRTAMLIEYAYRHEYAKSGKGGQNDNKYDLILSA